MFYVPFVEGKLNICGSSKKGNLLYGCGADVETNSKGLIDECTLRVMITAIDLNSPYCIGHPPSLPGAPSFPNSLGISAPSSKINRN